MVNIKERIINFTSACLAIVGIGFLYYFFVSDASVKGVFKDESFKGAVTRKFYDSNNRVQATIIIDNSKYVIPNKEMWDYISNGDYVIKTSGNLQCTVIRSYDTSKFFIIK